jgi:iron(III) transport system substrate-binding protein
VRTRGSVRVGALVAALLLVAGACGGSPTAEPEESGGGFAGLRGQTAEKIADINAELEGLSPEERREELISMAAEEGGVVSVYGSTNLDEMGPIIDEFEDATDVTVNYYRANSEDVLQRLIEEARAEFRGVDVVNTNGPEMTIIDREGLLAPLDTPVSEDITPEGVFDNWIWMYINTFTPAWNTDAISPSEAPKSWEDVLTKYEGGLAMEAADIDWFATLVKDYFVAEKGMTEDEAVDLFKQAASGGVVVDGHTLMTELLAAGEFDIAASPYLHRVLQLKGDGANIEWEPAIEPLVARPNGIGIHSAAKSVAAAMLFTEYVLTDAQALLPELDRQPASTAVEGGGLPTEYENILVDPEAVVDELDKWSGLYDEVVRSSSEDVIED